MNKIKMRIKHKKIIKKNKKYNSKDKKDNLENRKVSQDITNVLAHFS